MKQQTEREPQRGDANLQISQIQFSDVPGQSQLFLQYLQNPTSLREFYPNAVGSVEDVAKFVPDVLAAYKTDRNALCDALADYNQAAGFGEATAANIELLRSADTVAVVTGQQAGLFTGPLYTVYKALSAIKLTETLTANGTKAVPVFWIATEDHDFIEVSEAFFRGRSGETFKAQYRDNSEIDNLSVGEIRINQTISSLLDEIFADLPHTEFSDGTRELLNDAWHEGRGFGDAFAATLASLMGRYGLIVLDPREAAIKKLSAPIYAEAASKADEIASALTARNTEVESKGFHSQVLVDAAYFPLFWHDDDGRRKALRKSTDGVYRAKGARRGFTLAEIERAASDNPERFSPGVMLRPVVQDYLLPTIAYFGGGAEIAYFAQNAEVYRILNRPVTTILHRQSFTVVEKKHRRVLEKLGLDITQLFRPFEETLLKLGVSNISPETSRLFADVEEKINTEFNRLDQELSRIDVTLVQNLARRRRKMLYHIAALRKKTLLAMVRNDETAGRRLTNVFNALVPNGALQERSLNVFSFANSYGLNFIQWIYDSIDLDDKDHRIIDF